MLWPIPILYPLCSRVCSLIDGHEINRLKIEDLKNREGSELAPSSWLRVDQSRINAFADCTGDHQFIHLDPHRAARETPFGTTIAHGFLTLSLSVHLESPELSAIEDVGFVINYGLDKLRFISPVPADSRVRMHSTLAEVRDRGGGRVVIRLDKHMEVEGQEKPAWVAQQLLMLIPKDC